MKWKLSFALIIFSLIISLSLVNAATSIPEGEVSCSDSGLIIFPTQFTSIKANTTLLIHFHVYNGTSGEPIDSTEAFCGFHLHNKQGSHLYTDNNLTYTGSDTFLSIINGSNFSENGYYSYVVACFSHDQGEGGTCSSELEVTPTGFSSDSIVRPVSYLYIFGFFFFIGLILFFSFFVYKGSTPMKFTYLIMSVIFFLISLNMIFITLQDEIINSRIESFVDGFVVISFYLYWFLAGLLIIMWIFTFINTWFYKKNLQKFNSYGGLKYGA